MKILLVEDNKNLREGLLKKLRAAKLDVDSAADAKEALAKIDDIDFLLTDLQMPGMDGIELLRESRKRHPNIQAIVMTGFGSIPSAIEAMKEGARAYLTKPFDTEELLIHLRAADDIINLKKTAAKAGRGNLVGSSSLMRDVYTEIDIAAKSDTPVLITGGTGTGKNLTAQAIHNSSSRRDKPFITVNLGALPNDLIEGELYGHEKGAFTGAQSKKLGRFLVADEGTLFLDEIDSLPLALQPKLLRSIETNEIWPLGSEKAIHANVRIIAASNANIEKQIKEKTFRKDLYYRLNILRITLPPLHSHPEDIPMIAKTLLERIALRFSISNIEISTEALSSLITQPWHGNVRELSNTLERAVARLNASLDTERDKTETITITPEILNIPATETPASSEVIPKNIPFKEGKAIAADNWAKKTIQSTLTESNGNVSAAARALQMSRTALIRLINKYNLKNSPSKDSKE